MNNGFYNYALALVMLIGLDLFAEILRRAADHQPGHRGQHGGEEIAPPSPGTFPTTGLTFVALLIAVVLIVGGLNFFPALSLGPVVDHLLMSSGRTL